MNTTSEHMTHKDSAEEAQQADDDVDAALAELPGARELMQGYVLHAGISLGLFERLDSDPESAAVLAGDIDADPSYTYRLLRAMAQTAVVNETSDRSFYLTPVGKRFQADHPQSVRDGYLFWSSPDLKAAWNHLPEIVSEGEGTGFDREYGQGFFDYLDEHPELAAAFNNLMTNVTKRHTPAILETLPTNDFTAGSHICDVGGGHGYLLCHLLDTRPDLEGTVLDLPEVVAEEEQLWAPKLGVEDRCAYVAGDMSDTVPEADVYFLKNILEGFPDDESVAVLSTIKAAAPPDGRLFIIESFVPGPETPDYTKLLDIQMMVVSGGRERTEAEHRQLLEQAGWEVVGMRELDDGGKSVLEARIP